MFEAYTYKTSQGGCPECSKDCQEYGHCLDCEKFAKMMDRLNKYEQAEREGRLVVLPCKVGDMVYYTLCGRIFPVTVKQFRKNALQEWKVVIAFDSNYKEILDCVDFGLSIHAPA